MDELLAKLKELGFEMTFSGPCPIVSYGAAHWVFTKNPATTQMANGYGADEAAALSDAINTITKPR